MKRQVFLSLTVTIFLAVFIVLGFKSLRPRYFLDVPPTEVPHFAIPFKALDPSKKICAVYYPKSGVFLSKLTASEEEFDDFCKKWGISTIIYKEGGGTYDLKGADKNFRPSDSVKMGATQYEETNFSMIVYFDYSGNRNNMHLHFR